MATTDPTTSQSRAPLDAIKPLPTLSPSDLARFWSYLPDQPEQACWLWQGAVSARRYGVFGVGFGKERRLFLVHRLAFALFYGRDPWPLLVCHTCDTPLCCFGPHLFAGTAADNQADAQQKGRVSQGDAHWMRQHPEWITWRGENHPLRKHPERYANLAKRRAHLGIAHGQAKLNDEAVREIRQLYATGDVTQRELARRYGISQGTIGKILLRKIWTHI